VGEDENLDYVARAQSSGSTQVLFLRVRTVRKTIHKSCTKQESSRRKGVKAKICAALL
jgi:hypothetical protein